MIRSGHALVALAGAWLSACGSDPPPLEVAPTGEIAGSVVATDGGRVATTVLTLEGEAGGSVSAQTDAGGAYLFTSIPVGSWTLTALPPTGFALADGETGTKAVEVLAGRLAQVDFSFRPLNR